jgi:hypothetical protein
MTTEQERRGALEALERIVNRGGEPADVRREARAVLDRLYPGAQIDPDGRLHVPAAAEADGAFLKRYATLLSPYCGEARAP